jgi:GNAT superfamily N-acetyltransferase
MEIRMLQSDEIPQALQIARGVFDYCLKNRMDDPKMIEDFRNYTDESQIQNMEQQGSIHLWGIFEDGRMLAMSAMQREGHITMLYVLPMFQCRGYGAALLERMRAFAYEKYGYAYVTLSAMPAWTASYFAKHKFVSMNAAADHQAPFLPMQAKTLRQLAYENRPISDGCLIGTSLAGLAVCVAVAVGFMIYYL